MSTHTRLPTLPWVVSILLINFVAASFAQTNSDEPPEHPVIKPMNGAMLQAGVSKVVAYGELAVSYRQDGKIVRDRVGGRFWDLSYQLADRDKSRDEIMANYASEVSRVGGEVLSRTGTRLRFRIADRSQGTIWGILDTRGRGAYRIEIVDEAGLEINLEFDADAMHEALIRDGSVAIYGILFDVDRADLRSGSGEVLDTVAQVLKRYPDLHLEVQGHTDSTGTAERNMQLSLQRAQQVSAALTLYGVEANRLVAKGFGSTRPVGDNTTQDGRQLNRRVELKRLN